MKGFNAKKKKSKKRKAKQGLIQNENKTKLIWSSEMRSFLIWEKGELGLMGSHFGEKKIKF